MNRPILLILVVVLGVLGVSSLFIVTETEYAIKFQLGRIVKSDYEPGIHLKLPFVNNIRKFDNRSSGGLWTCSVFTHPLRATSGWH